MSSAPLGFSLGLLRRLNSGEGLDIESRSAPNSNDHQTRTKIGPDLGKVHLPTYTYTPLGSDPLDPGDQVINCF